MLSPRRKVVLFAVPAAEKLLVPMLVRLAPEPLNVPEKVPPVIVPERVGEADRTTLPLPVEPVVQEIDVPLVAAQKSLVVSVPKLAAAPLPMLIQLVPSQ